MSTTVFNMIPKVRSRTNGQTTKKRQDLTPFDDYVTTNSVVVNPVGHRGILFPGCVFAETGCSWHTVVAGKLG